MSKRFTDTDKYKKGFMRGLQGAYKLLWDYLYHDCNYAGIWHVDFKVAQIYLGEDMPVNKKDALKFFNHKQKRIIIVNHGDKWFIKPFVEFQYGILNPDNKVHRSVINELKRNGISKEFVSPLQGAKDKEQEQDKEKEKEKEKDFEKLWEKYPRKLGKNKALTHFKAQVKNEQDLKDINIALDNYLKSENVVKGNEKYIQHGSTWFNNWKDWIDYKENGLPKSEIPL